MEPENNNTAVNQQETNQQEGARTGEKMFTQEEVNEIIKNRLNRAKKQDEGDNPLSAKEAELNAREMRLTAREMIAAAELPSELASVLNCKDEKELKANIEILTKYFKKDEKEPKKGFVVGAPGNDGNSKVDPIRKAMGL